MFCNLYSIDMAAKGKQQFYFHSLTVGYKLSSENFLLENKMKETFNNNQYQSLFGN